MKELDVKINFLAPERGGRSQTPKRMLESRQYRPHLITKPISECQDIDYMGVCFTEQSDDILPNNECMAKIALMYEGVDYSSLIKGTKFDIVEGNKIIGNGCVI